MKECENTFFLYVETDNKHVIKQLI